MSKKETFDFDTSIDKDNDTKTAVKSFLSDAEDKPRTTTAPEIDGLPKMYDAHDIAEITGIHYVSVTKLFKDGRIKGKKFGRTWKATEQALKEFMCETN